MKHLSEQQLFILFSLGQSYSLITSLSMISTRWNNFVSKSTKKTWFSMVLFPMSACLLNQSILRLYHEFNSY